MSVHPSTAMTGTSSSPATAADAPAGIELAKSRSAAARRSRRPAKLKLILSPYLFTLPFVALFALFVLTPIGYDAYLSFYRQTLLGTHFAGFSNFRDAFSNSQFWTSFARVAVYGVIFVPVMLGIATLFALLLDFGYIPFGKSLRVLMFLPFTLPGALVILVWGFLYEPQFGSLTTTLNDVGVHGVNFLGSGLVLPSIANIQIWAYTGFNMLIIYTALRAVSPETVEAAVVDGASVLRIGLRIKLPQIHNVIIGLAVFGVLGSMQLFTEPFLLTPLTNTISDHYTPTILTYNVLTFQQNYGYAAALAFVLTTVSLLVVGGFMVASRFKRLRGADG